MITQLIQNIDDNTYNTYKINHNGLTDKTKLYNIKHYLDITFPPIPYLWHYDDFAQPFPVYGIVKVSIYKLKKLVNNIPSDLTDKNCDTYILAQYKKEKVLYSKLSNPYELYISYHTWLYYNLTKSCIINNNEINFKFRFLTGICEISGKLETYENYPFKNNSKKSPGGISINGKLEMRQAIIHKHENNIKFSGINVCNFNQLSDNAVFLSILKYPNAQTNNSKNKSNCVVLHIFRNVYDNNPENEEFQELISKFMT